MLNSRLYSDYVKKYNLAKNAAIKANLPYTKMFSRVEFEGMFTAQKNTFEEDGLKKSVNQTIDAVIDRQMNTYSLKQAKILKKGLAAMGDNSITLRELQSLGGLELDELEGMSAENVAKVKKIKSFWDQVANRRQEFLNSGMSTEDAETLIAAEFFGS